MVTAVAEQAASPAVEPATAPAVEPAQAAEEEEDRNPLLEPETPEEAADKAEYILELLVAAKGGARRAGQVHMAREVAMSIFGQRPLLVEGPTGTGKGFAYLAGALACGQQTVVATHTKALQDQLASDMELIMSAMEGHDELWDITPTFAVLKGRGAYACRSKFAPRDGDDAAEALFGDDFGSDQKQPSSELGAEVQRLAKWAETTESGDRTDVPFQTSAKAWAMASTTADDCTGKACPLYSTCFAEVARAKANKATIIITNQTLLAMSMRLPILPDTVSAVIIDESQEFGNVTSDAFGAEVSFERLEGVVKRCSALDVIGKKQSEGLKESASRSIASLSKMVKVPKKFDSDRETMQKDSVKKALASLRSRFAELNTFALSFPMKNEKDKGIKDVTRRMLAKIIFDIDLLIEGTTDTQVTWVDRGFRDTAVMHSAKYEVSEIIYNRLIHEYRSVVFTSATLTVAGEFTAPAKEFGFTKGPWTGVVVESPFDFAKQGRVWYPENMPLPNDPAFYTRVAETTVEVARAAGGRTMTLCTSWKGVNEVAEIVRAELGDEFPVIVQEPGAGFNFLRDQFQADPRTILIATRTFWTGVSFEGDTCVATIIDKVPFPSPGDPKIAARSEAADKRGGSGFGEVSLPIACLTITQGAGRLIRTIDDHGVVIICDPRVNPSSRLKKGYAREIKRSLPPFTHVESKTDVLGFLRQIDQEALAAE